MPKGGMQLTTAYKDRLSTAFLAYYHGKFTSDRMFYAHWSATGRCAPEGAYHRETILDANHGAATLNPSNVTLDTDMFEHTSNRNTNATAYCVACEGGGSPEALGDNQATKAMLVEFVRAIASGCVQLKVPVANLMTHAEAADCVDGFVDPDGHYGPHSSDFQRWDWYVFTHSLSLALVSMYDGSKWLYPGDAPAGCEYFGDWLRGQVILEIQEQTKGDW